MNKQITRVTVIAVLLLAALIGATTYWQTWAAAGLADKQDNAIQRVAQFTIKRGLIYSGDGVPLSANRTKKIGGQTLYFRRYPSDDLASNIVGYSTQTRSRAGLERSENDYLTASNGDLGTVLDRTLNKLKGTTVTGNNLVLTLKARVQRLAEQQLDGNCGAVVALEPSTGKVLVMTTSPRYDPNLVENHFNLIDARSHGNCKPHAPLYNRATYGLFVPGSTFKIITAAAALDSGKFGPDSGFYDPGYCVEYGKQVHNAADQNGPEQFGNVNLHTAFQHSINAVFCQIGQKLGAGKILEYARRFGFYQLPPLETPTDERAPSGLYSNHQLFRPKHDYDVDPGRLAFGQERMLVTPLQMAMVAGAVANGGAEMRPYVVDRVESPSHHVVTRTRPRTIGHPISPKTADQLTSMMVAAVTAGTGTHAQIPGVRVAGKTGTAETGVTGINTTWFVSFAPADKPRVAVAVVLENQHGFGGTTAAPIAKTIMEAILRSRSK
jgi:peptidoglycan glycosyltransferase